MSGISHFEFKIKSKTNFLLAIGKNSDQAPCSVASDLGQRTKFRYYSAEAKWAKNLLRFIPSTKRLRCYYVDDDTMGKLSSPCVKSGCGFIILKFKILSTIHHQKADFANIPYTRDETSIKMPFIYHFVLKRNYKA